MSTFVLPDLGEGLQEAELVAWHVGEGDHVVADQPLVSVETEKAVVEVPSPQDGKIARLCVQPGDRLKVGAPLVEFEEGPRTDSGTIVGELSVAASPPLNAWYDGRTMERRLLKQIDLGLAVDTEDGLFVPVLRNIGERDAADLRRGIEAMKKDVRARKVPVAELRGQTITLSNFGMFAGRFAALVIVPPQVAILGAGRITERPVVAEGNVAAHRILPLSLTFDHRAVTGGEAARFLKATIEDLEKAD